MQLAAYEPQCLRVSYRISCGTAIWTANVDVMAETEDDNTKKANNQAWRKKPRNFAPKSRLGCKTCK